MKHHNLGDDTPEESTYVRRMREGRSRSPLRMQAREIVQECLLKEDGDPDGFMLDVVSWDEWEDFVNFAESVISDMEALTWP